MILWRIVKKHFIEGALAGEGARLFGGHWNSPGLSVVYTTTSKSHGVFIISTLLELKWDNVQKGLSNWLAIPILVPNEIQIKQVDYAKFPKDWYKKPAPKITKEIGDRWLSEKETVILMVPSANLYGTELGLINPLHKDFTQLIPAPAESISWEDDPLIESKIMETERHKDVFLCHATEDKENIVDPLYRELFMAGITCWYDDAEIKWGDSITKKVNEGLSKSDYVLVILTDNFFKNEYPQRELNAALHKEASSGRVVVLPIIYGDDEFKKRLTEELFLQSDKSHIEWKDNPEEIARYLHEILRTN